MRHSILRDRYTRPPLDRFRDCKESPLGQNNDNIPNHRNIPTTLAPKSLDRKSRLRMSLPGACRARRCFHKCRLDHPLKQRLTMRDMLMVLPHSTILPSGPTKNASQSVQKSGTHNASGKPSHRRKSHGFTKQSTNSQSAQSIPAVGVMA